MTELQRLVKEKMESKGKSINWDELKFKVESDKDYYFRILPDGNDENVLWYQPHKMYKLSDTVYVNYPDGYNKVQETLNKIWTIGDTVAKSVYSSMKGKQQYNVNVLLCDSMGNPVEKKTHIWTVTSKKLWDQILAAFFESDFINDKDLVFKMRRTGDKLDTVYNLKATKAEPISFAEFEIADLSLPLAFAKSDTKAKPIIDKLMDQFELDEDYEEFEKKLKDL